MKYASIALACLLGVAVAQEDGEKPKEEPPEQQPAEEGCGEEEESEKAPPPPAAPADPKKIIADLTLANAAKDVGRIDTAAKEALAWAKGAKDEATAETLAVELADSIKAAKGNYGTLNVVVEALGELRTKEGLKSLKKIGFQKKAKDAQDEKLQAYALVGVGKFGDPKDVPAFEEAAKSESTVVAKGAYEALGLYGPAKAKIRKQCVELLMKRVDMEYPSSGGQGGKSVSAEKQARWAEVSPAIVGSLKALCRENTINDVDNWREWWKENKKKAWKDDDES
ncbi:MAG: HEAT repeat domain-containing protein [Planctomycetes bacterium]|nr:HEAT repeat domain-containing protein [Planctomycetota bacterium]